jgi:hypothetical protein
MDPRMRAAVRARAEERCEYCRLPEAASFLPFEMEHIIAEKHGGPSSFDNLAFACRYCNAYKGPNIAGIDPLSGQISPLFHPRRDAWREHFRWNGTRLIGLSAPARASIEVLRMNHPEMSRKCPFPGMSDAGCTETARTSERGPPACHEQRMGRGRKCIACLRTPSRWYRPERSTSGACHGD